MKSDTKEKLLPNEESKQNQYSGYSSEMLSETSVPNSNFDMTQKTLTSMAIKPKDLRAKIEEYLESDGVTRDQLKLLLKQGAEDNNLFMIKEQTYDKLADVLDIKLDHDSESDLSNISGLLATLRNENQSSMHKTHSFKSLEASANRFAAMMQNRARLRNKSVIGVKNLEEIGQIVSSTIQSIDEEDIKIKKSNKDSKNVHLKYIGAQETSPNLMERIPFITNQGLKNNLIVAGITFISL